MNAVHVRGNATAEEVAAVVAAVSTRGDARPKQLHDPYARWRATRFAALRQQTAGWGRP